jgi:hypothetical protein
MGSLIDELKRREAAAGEEAEELRGRIAQLIERLAQADERLSRLVIAGETVDEVPNGAGSEAGVMPEGAVPSRFGHLSPVELLAVLPWREGLEASALPEVYRDLLEAAEDAGRPLQAVQIAAAAALSREKAKVEGLRSKLKRLVERGWLVEEAGPGCSPCRCVRIRGNCRRNRGDSGVVHPWAIICLCPYHPILSWRVPGCRGSG